MSIWEKMHVYLAPWKKTDGCWRPTSIEPGMDFVALDLRVDATGDDGFCFLRVRERRDRPGMEYLGQDMDDRTISAAKLINSRFNLSMVRRPLGTLLGLARLFGPFMPLQPNRNGYEVWFGDRICTYGPIAGGAASWDEDWGVTNGSVIGNLQTWIDSAESTANYYQIGVDHRLNVGTELGTDGYRMSICQTPLDTKNFSVSVILLDLSTDSFLNLAGPMGRCTSTSIANSYVMRAYVVSGEGRDGHELVKYVSNDPSVIQANGSDHIEPQTMELVMVESVITGKRNGSTMMSLSDSSVDGTVVGGKYGGIWGYRHVDRFFDFGAAHAEVVVGGGGGTAGLGLLDGQFGRQLINGGLVR